MDGLDWRSGGPLGLWSQDSCWDWDSPVPGQLLGLRGTGTPVPTQDLVKGLQSLPETTDSSHQSGTVYVALRNPIYLSRVGVAVNHKSGGRVIIYIRHQHAMISA